MLAGHRRHGGRRSRRQEPSATHRSSAVSRRLAGRWGRLGGWCLSAACLVQFPMVGNSLEIEAGLGIEVGEDRSPLAYSHAVLGPDHPTVFVGPKTPRLPPAT